MEQQEGGVAFAVVGDHENRPTDMTNIIVVSYGIDAAITTGGNCTAQGPCIYREIEGTLKASAPHAVAIIKADDREDTHREEIL